MSNAIFADGNWLMHRAESAGAQHTAYPERKVPLLILNWYCEYAIRFRASHGALCFDGSDNFRYQVFPDYKKNRKADPDSVGANNKDAVYRHLLPTLRLFKLLNLSIFQHDTFEADDLMAAGAHSWANRSPNNHSTIVCLDKDLLQCVSSRTNVYFPEISKRPSKLYDTSRVLEDRGLLPKQFSDYQVLIGDSTDNVPSLMAPKKSMAVLREHGTLKRWFETKEGKTFFLAHTSELIRNKQLIRMSHKCWAPTEGDLKLSPIRSNDHFIKEEFGNLPASLTSLRSINSPKKSLF